MLTHWCQPDNTGSWGGVLARLRQGYEVSPKRSLSLIAPEAKAGTSGDGGRGNIVIGGGQEGGWDLTVDGVSATPGVPFEQRLWTTLDSPSVEAITEFAIDTNGFKAEMRPCRRRCRQLRGTIGHGERCQTVNRERRWVSDFVAVHDSPSDTGGGRSSRSVS
jgi:hypothetical protein